MNRSARFWAQRRSLSNPQSIVNKKVTFLRIFLNLIFCLQREPIQLSSKQAWVFTISPLSCQLNVTLLLLLMNSTIELPVHYTPQTLQTLDSSHFNHFCEKSPDSIPLACFLLPAPSATRSSKEILVLPAWTFHPSSRTRYRLPELPRELR